MQLAALLGFINSTHIYTSVVCFNAERLENNFS